MRQSFNFDICKRFVKLNVYCLMTEAACWQHEMMVIIAQCTHGEWRKCGTAFKGGVRKIVKSFSRVSKFFFRREGEVNLPQNRVTSFMYEPFAIVSSKQPRR